MFSPGLSQPTNERGTADHAKCILLNAIEGLVGITKSTKPTVSYLKKSIKTNVIRRFKLLSSSFDFWGREGGLEEVRRV
jgi:hypothetical protein